MSKYTPNQRDQGDVPIELPRPQAMRGNREPEVYQEPLFLWIFSLKACYVDGEVYHGVTYTVQPSAQQANDAGWVACYRGYPEAEGFTKHDIAMHQIEPKHVVIAARWLMTHGGRA